MSAQAPDSGAPALDERSSDVLVNRELSWVDFNDRVLQLAEDDRTPLLERVKFASIFASNLDEFFMIRVAGLHDQVEAGVTELRAGLTPSQVIDAIRERVLALIERHRMLVEDELLGALSGHGIRILGLAEISEEGRRSLRERFGRQIFPVLTPLAVGQGRPFPYISGLSLSIGARVHDPVAQESSFARIKVPTEMLPRFVAVEPGGTEFVALEELMADNLDVLFPGMEIVEHGCFRVTRDADLEISGEADDLLEAVELELRRRRFGEVVRLELEAGISDGLREEITTALEVEDRQIYEVAGLLDLEDLWQIYKLPGLAELRDPPWSPVTQPRLQSENGPPDMFAAIREGDILVHHPYDSYPTSVERFVEQAAADPDVLAIKLTIYRTSDDTPLLPALIRATEHGKQAVCLVELKARFDERANIEWARRLEQMGVHVVYGHPTLKTHAKAVLVVRREGDGIRRYVHVGTGNYNPDTARLYTDFGLFTCDDDLGADVADVFNHLTGFARTEGFRRALVAPMDLRDGIVAEIERTIAAAREGHRARIRMKMNSLVDRTCIDALCRAGQAGVEVELNVRGICRLVPGIPGRSDNIRVVSVLGRFLEHSRIYSFERGDEIEVYIGSGDLMPRNLDTRVELVVPICDAALRDEVLDTLDRAFADEHAAWDLRTDGSWERRVPGSEPRNLQRELMQRHSRRASHSDDPAGG